MQIKVLPKPCDLQTLGGMLSRGAEARCISYLARHSVAHSAPATAHTQQWGMGDVMS